MKVFSIVLKKIRSISFQVGLVAFLFLVLPMIVILSVYYSNIRDREISSLAANITSQAQLIASQIVDNGYISGDESKGIDVRLDSLKDFFVGRIMIMDKSMKILMDTYNLYEGRVLIWENALRSASGDTVSHYDNTNNLLTVTIPIGSAEDLADGNVSGVVLITRNTDYIDQNMQYFYRIAIIGIVIAFFLAAVSAFISSKIVSVPLFRLRQNITDMSDGNRQKLDESKITEVSQLSDSINSFTDKLRRIDDQMRGFVSNVSHELKTPLTSMKILADSINNSEDVPIDFYKEFMGDITKEIDRESAIIDDLLKLVRTDSQTATFEPESINLNDMMEEILKSLRPLAEKAGVELLLETFKPVLATIDRVKFSQAMINLVENAIKYNRDEGGFVHVSVNGDDSFAYIRVEDNGVGIPEEDQDRIFERFFRVDKSHSKEIEGTGLGLAIVKNIINLHGGQIKVESIENMGTSFIIRIPLFTERNRR